jgi:two-component system CheB/CheR fusion protein
MRLLPYRTRDNLIDGVVVTFMDITERKRAEQTLWSSRLMYVAQNLESTSREAFLVLDGDLKVITANPAFYTYFKTIPQETEGRRVYELGNRQWDIPRFKELLEQIIPEKAAIADFAVEHNFPGIGVKKLLLNARRFHSDQQIFIILAIEDITAGQGREAPPPQP